LGPEVSGTREGAAGRVLSLAGTRDDGLRAHEPIVIR